MEEDEQVRASLASRAKVANPRLQGFRVSESIGLAGCGKFGLYIKRQWNLPYGTGVTEEVERIVFEDR